MSGSFIIVQWLSHIVAVVTDDSSGPSGVGKTLLLLRAVACLDPVAVID
jgi:hypothetical protein